MVADGFSQHVSLLLYFCTNFFCLFYGDSVCTITTVIKAVNELGYIKTSLDD